MLNVSTVSLVKKDRLQRAMIIWHENFLTAVIVSSHYVCEIQLNREIDSCPVILYYRRTPYSSASESTVDLLSIWRATIVDRLISKDLGSNVDEVHTYHLNTIPKEDLVDITQNWYATLIDLFREYALGTKVVVRLRSDAFVIIDGNTPLFFADAGYSKLLFHNLSDIAKSPVHNYRSALGNLITSDLVYTDKALTIKRSDKRLAKKLLEEFSSRYTACNTTNSVFDDIQL